MQPPYINPHPDLDFFTCSHCKQISEPKRFILQTLTGEDPSEFLSKASAKEFQFEFCKESSPVTFDVGSPYNDNSFDPSDFLNPLLNRLMALKCNICKRIHLFADNTPAKNLEAEAERYKDPSYGYHDDEPRPTYQLLYPILFEAPLPSEEMPITVKKIYNEARSVLPHSTSASCLLLRRALETLLCLTLKKEKGELKDLIPAFFKKHNHLEEALQASFEVVRLYGNTACHNNPNELHLMDDEDNALMLCDCINLIVDSVITYQKRVEALLAQHPKGNK
ncbi:MAG: DUF4145 domain-containing protein [Vampirovibrio sp.]|nr:DUF4145 domain-containing protein [Vampirovibrio sp.]